jgi:Protein of unknown function (DUF1488)
MKPGFDVRRISRTTVDQGGQMSFFAFPEDGHWDEARDAVAFSVALGAYEGEVRVPRAVIRRLAGSTVTPEQCVEYYFLHRTRFERAAEAKLRRRDLDEDSNVTLSGRDLREGAS